MDQTGFESRAPRKRSCTTHSTVSTILNECAVPCGSMSIKHALQRFAIKVLDAAHELVRGHTGVPPNREPSGEPEIPREMLPVNSEMTLCPQCAKAIAGNGSTRVPMKIKPGQRVIVMARPQRVAFRPEMIIIENGERWTVHDIRIGNRSQFAQSGDVPGIVFAPGASPFLRLETAQTAMDVAFDVTYCGPEQDGEQFRASVVGPSAHMSMLFAN